MKFVYVLISSKKDYFAEQALLSMYSVKKHNPDAEIVLVCDASTLNRLQEERNSIMDDVDEFITENLPTELNDVQKNRYLKTSLRQIVKGDFLYLDNDTIITGNLDDLKNLTVEFGAVLNHHVMLDINKNLHLKKYLEKTKKDFWNYYKYFNGGAFYAKDTPECHKFFESWHRIWNEDRKKYGISIDQPAFAQANMENNRMIEEISGIYNCQITQRDAIPYMFDAKIIHYFSNSPTSCLFPLTQPNVLKSVREKGITEEMEKLLERPQIAYLKNSVIIRGEELRSDYNSPIMIFARKIARTFPFLNNIIRTGYRIFGVKI